MEFDLEEFKYELKPIDEQENQQQENRIIARHAGFQSRDVQLIKNMSEDYNFMIVNDMFLWKDAFQLYYEEDSMGFCPLNKYRPPIATYIQKNYGYTVHEESYHGFTNPQEIECICKILESLQINKAYQVAQFVKRVIIPQQQKNFQIQQDILARYINREDTIKNVLNKNFERSLQMAHSFLANLSENPQRIIKYQIKKFCFDSMSHKVYSAGGSLGFINLIQGNYTFIQQSYSNIMDYLMHYSRSIKLPEVLDQRGIIDLYVAFFSGEQEIDMNIVTVEGFTIMGKGKILNYPLSEVELIDGYRVCDYLSVVDLSFNQKLLDDLALKRKEIDQRLLNGTLEYYPYVDSFYQKDKLGRLIDGYQFIKKFYPEEYENLISKNNKQIKQVDDKINQKILNQIQQKLNQNCTSSQSISQKSSQIQCQTSIQEHQQNNFEEEQQMINQFGQSYSPLYDPEDVQRFYLGESQNLQFQEINHQGQEEYNGYIQYSNQIFQDESYNRFNLFENQDIFSN